MPGSQDIYQSSRKLITFISKYTDLIERHLNSSKDMMNETCELVMAGINDIAKTTSDKKTEAEQILVETYTDPNQETEEAMESVQSAVTGVFDEASNKFQPVSASTRDKSVEEIKGDGADELRDKVRRAGGLFSKHMEALSSLDDDVQNLLLTMMGALSRDDVVSQKIEHAAAAMHSLQTSLGYILVDYEQRCRDGEVDKFMTDLKQFVYNSYTTKEEREFFYNSFPEEREQKEKKIKHSS